jgi:hypothetical protein
LSVTFESRFAWLLRALLSPELREAHPSQTPIQTQRTVPALWTKNGKSGSGADARAVFRDERRAFFARFG